ncbi:MAG: hypothetical protein II304_12015 [Bacteroidales bacterium]|nr:hypothetical protein [Bacteroidales bacterium]
MATFIYYIRPEFVKEIPYHITQEDAEKMVKENKAVRYGLPTFENDFNLGKISNNGFILIVTSDKSIFNKI